MKQIIEFFKDMTWEKFLKLLTNWFVILFLVSFLILLICFIFILSTNVDKSKQKVLNKNLSIVRLFSIHYEENFVYAIDKFNFVKKRKETLDWFYNSFTPQDKLRLVVWVKELLKQKDRVPLHLELHVKVKSIKQPVFCVISVSSINYDKKIIHMESRLFPNIKKITKKTKFAKNIILHSKDIPELLKNHPNSQKNVFLIRLYSTNELDSNDSRINHLVMTLIISRLVRYCSDYRQICSLNDNEIVIIDFKMINKNEAFAFSHTISNEISKVLFLSSEDEEFNYKIGIVQRKECSSSLQEEIKLAREMSIYAEKGEQNVTSVIYDENLTYQNKYTDLIISDIRKKMDRRQFSCKYTPILNTYDGSIFGYNCELSAQKALVASIGDMQDYAAKNNFLTDLNRILYYETNLALNYSNLQRFVYTTMEFKPNQYLSLIDIYAHTESPRHVRTIFILQDTDLLEDQKISLNIVKELKHANISLGLKLTTSSIELSTDIMRTFDFFFISEESFPNLLDSQQQIFFNAMIIRLSSYSGQLIATNASSWAVIDYLCRCGVKHISSPLFNQAVKELPEVENKKANKLVNIAKHY